MDGRKFEGRVDEPKGDPGNTLSTAELQTKALGLASFSKAATAEEMKAWIPLFANLANAPRAPRFFGP